ncbi:hypothetical protein [Paracoccus onubensis]|uniref:Uncharacterized protein n=1 Tax=Paracoccus onubensis TaxID=1675788 RepID=A0A418T7Q0_9RHOB|nr:hypothetical protein [Paracoccus onubensis]RJE89251.1 hypothetical protein D3P04_00965 [Paracoccus onubensis]
MTTLSTAGTPGAADWLTLAAMPGFALMAGITSMDVNALCLSDPGMLPMNGMTTMYLLMSLFHLPPWLRLMSGRKGTGCHGNPTGDRS